MHTNNAKTNVKIIDRTLPEIITGENNTKKNDIVYMCWLLKDLGVDLIEINRAVGSRMKLIPSGINFLYRIEDKEDVEICVSKKIKNAVIDLNLALEDEILFEIEKKGLGVLLEIRASQMEEISSRIGGALARITNLWGIRILGLEYSQDHNWAHGLSRLREKTGKAIDICPLNIYNTATAIAFEALEQDTDYLTMSFTGYGINQGYAALEEVLAAASILIQKYDKRQLKFLPALVSQFTRISGATISKNKPVIGKEIFNYESGIHADGINKNPLTYEPFEPSWVGLERKLVIGKHSGSGALIKKLESLGIELDAEKAEMLLEMVRDKSIENKRSLKNRELLEIIEVSQ